MNHSPADTNPDSNYIYTLTQQGDANVQCALGGLYADGIGVPQEHKHAIGTKKLPCRVMQKLNSI